MIEQQGRVIHAREGRATVRLGGQTGCAACDAGRGCGAGLFGRLLRRNPVDLVVDNLAGAHPGDVVTLGIPDRRFLGMTAWLFMLPLLAGLAGAVLAMTLVPATFQAGARDAFTALGGMVAAAVAWAIAHRRLPRQVSALGVEMRKRNVPELDCAPIDHH